MEKEKGSNQVAVFKQFAEKELKNHIAELNTHYQNEPLASDELKQDAYQAHQKIYSEELEEKIKSLLSIKDNVVLKGELENLKDEYIRKMNLNQVQ